MWYIEENTFAEACYNQKSIGELEAILDHAETNLEPDQADMEAWGIDEQQWYAEVELALTCLKWERALAA